MNPAAHRLEITVLPARYAICRLAPQVAWPALQEKGAFVSVTRTDDELSVVCEERFMPADALAERGRRLLRVLGPLDFSSTGVLAALAAPLAAAGISIFAISTYDTDYLLVPENDLEPAIATLERAGHAIHRSQTE